MASLVDLDPLLTETLPAREEAFPLQELSAGLGAERCERPAAEVLAERLAEDSVVAVGPFLVP
jgi:hypothetical protein